MVFRSMYVIIARNIFGGTIRLFIIPEDILVIIPIVVVLVDMLKYQRFLRNKNSFDFQYSGIFKRAKTGPPLRFLGVFWKPLL